MALKTTRCQLGQCGLFNYFLFLRNGSVLQVYFCIVALYCDLPIYRGRYKVIRRAGYQLKTGQMLGLTVRPEPVEECTVKPLMVRQAHHERLNLNLSRFKLVADVHKLSLSQGFSNVILRK